MSNVINLATQKPEPQPMVEAPEMSPAEKFAAGIKHARHTAACTLHIVHDSPELAARCEADLVATIRLLQGALKVIRGQS